MDWMSQVEQLSRQFRPDEVVIRSKGTVIFKFEGTERRSEAVNMPRKIMYATYYRTIGTVVPIYEVKLSPPQTLYDGVDTASMIPGRPQGGDVLDKNLKEGKKSVFEDYPPTGFFTIRTQLYDTIVRYSFEDERGIEILGYDEVDDFVKDLMEFGLKNYDLRFRPKRGKGKAKSSADKQNDVWLEEAMV